VIEIEGAKDQPFAQGGDSGSLVVNENKEALGLVFATSDLGGANGKGLAYVNPMSLVLDKMQGAADKLEITMKSSVPTLEEARAAKIRAKEVFHKLADVAGIGITRLETGYGIKVNLQKQPSPQVSLPSELDGVPIQLEITGGAHKI
jgi:hypothetical protein